MSKREAIDRHRLIISKLRRQSCTFEQLQDFLRYESEISGYDFTCSLRTFQRDKRDIKSLYNIVIEYDPALRAYEIVEDGNEEHHERLMEAFEIYNALNMSSNFSDKIILEKRKSLGTDHLYGLLHSIKTYREITFDYRSYYDDSLSKRRVQPVAIKEALNRWYLLAKDTKNNIFKSFGLDRIEQLEITNKKFAPHTDYDPDADYRYAFGIINGTGEKPQDIELSFTPREGRYIKSLPLHHSQQLIQENEEETVFAYRLIPTYDFKQEILSYGDQVEVIKPAQLRKQIIAQLTAALGKYV